jgi:SprT protein
MKTPIPVSRELITKVEDRVLELYLQAQRIWEKVFDVPLLHFDLAGTTAGRAYYQFRCIRLNPILLLENESNFIHRTVAHECAHLIAFEMHGPIIRPHGPEWKDVMVMLGLDPKRCHNYDTSRARVRRQRFYRYGCNCRAIWKSGRTHFRIQRRELSMTCSWCNSHFMFQEEIR